MNWKFNNPSPSRAPPLPSPGKWADVHSLYLRLHLKEKIKLLIYFSRLLNWTDRINRLCICKIRKSLSKNLIKTFHLKKQGEERKWGGSLEKRAGENLIWRGCIVYTLFVSITFPKILIFFKKSIWNMASLKIVALCRRVNFLFVFQNYIKS